MVLIDPVKLSRRPPVWPRLQAVAKKKQSYTCMLLDVHEYSTGFTECAPKTCLAHAAAIATQWLPRVHARCFAKHAPA